MADLKDVYIICIDLYPFIERTGEYQQILVSSGSPGNIALQIPSDNLSFCGVKNYMWFFDCAE